MHLAQLLKARVGCHVPVANVTTGKEKNRKKVGEDLCKFGFTPNYTCWIFHGEADRMREEVVRQRLEDFYGDAGVPDMMDDFHEAQFGEGMEEEPEETVKAFYDMMSLAQQPLHEKTEVSRLDAVGRLMGFKS